MGENTKKYSNLIFLFIFTCVALFANFVHTEKTLTPDDKCPACHFQHSSLTTAHIPFFILTLPAFFKPFESFESFHYIFCFPITSNSRSPPQI